MINKKDYIKIELREMRIEKARSVHGFQKGDEQEVGVDVKSSSLNFLFHGGQETRDFEI